MSIASPSPVLSIKGLVVPECPLDFMAQSLADEFHRGHSDGRRVPAVIPCGTCDACKRFTMDKVELRLSNLMAFHARALGNWGCRPELYPAAFDLVLQGRVKVCPFVEQHPLAYINKVFTAGAYC